MTINSRTKGATAERELAALVEDLAGVRLIRNLEQSRSGGFDLMVHPDQTGQAADTFRKLAIECKRYSSVTHSQLAGFWAQAVRQAEGAGLLPVLAYRADRSPWKVVLPACLVNPSLTHCLSYEYAITASIEGFCHFIAET